jgi:hypothetical protein
MRLFLVSAFLIFLLGAQSGAWADPTIKAEADKTSITIDQVLTYKLIVVSRQKDIPSLKIPAFKGFAVISRVQSSSVSFQKGGLQTNLMLIFRLRPEQAGRVKIEPAQVLVQGKAYATEALQIEIKPGSIRTQPREEEPGLVIPDSGQPKYNL